MAAAGACDVMRVRSIVLADPGWGWGGGGAS